MTKFDVISAILSAVENSIQIDTAEYVIPTDEGFVGVKISSKRAVATEKTPAFDLDAALAKWNEKVARKAEKEAKGNTDKEAEREALKEQNDALRSQIVEALKSNNPLTAPEIIEAIGNSKISTQKISSVMRQLITDGKVVKGEKDKHTAYSLAE